MRLLSVLACSVGVSLTACDRRGFVFDDPLAPEGGSDAEEESGCSAAGCTGDADSGDVDPGDDTDPGDSDGDSCTTADCFCLHANPGDPCDDNDPCTSSSTCVEGRCQGGPVDKDSDSDGYVDAACPGGNDCDDTSARAHPSGHEDLAHEGTCWDGVDNDCSGPVDSDEVACPKVVFRSVGPGNLSPLAFDGGGLAIAGGRASFASALPDRVGVGDAVAFDSNGDGAPDQVLFITWRLDSRRFVLKTSAGTKPADVAPGVWSIYRAYTSLHEAEDGAENAGIPAAVRDFDVWSSGRDLLVNDEIWQLACYGDGTDTSVAIDGWTGGAANYLRVFTPVGPFEVGASQRHHGTWDSDKYLLSSSNGDGIDLRFPYVRIEGLQVDIGCSNYCLGVAAWILEWTDGDVRVSHNIIRGPNSSAAGDNSHFGIQFDEFSSAAGTTIRVWNNVVYDFRGSAGYVGGIYVSDEYAIMSTYANTVYHCATGFAMMHGAADFKNNLSYDNDLNYGTYADTPTGTNNLSGPAQGGAFGDNGRNNQTVAFVDATNRDLHLAAADTGAAAAGADLSTDAALVVSDDIDGESRPGTQSGWDIGADEQ